MKIYVVGSSKNKFLPLDNIREKFLIDEKHEGDNIDFLNPWCCELTGLYYLWKHVDDDVVGLEHYRRYFVNEKGNLLSEGEIKEILKDHDVICPFQFNSRNEWFCNPGEMLFGKTSVLAKSQAALKHFLFVIRMYDENFWNFIKNVWLKKRYIMSNNMFICRKKVINDYCEYMFKCLLEVKDIFPQDLNETNYRVYGYITECLFGAYLEYKKFKIYQGSRNFLNKF